MSGSGKMPGGIQGMANRMMQEAQQMEQKLATERVEATSGGGAVKAIVNGKGNLMELKISPEVVDPSDIEMLQDLVLTAVRDAISKANDMEKQSLKSVIPPGFNIPGMF